MSDTRTEIDNVLTDWAWYDPKDLKSILIQGDDRYSWLQGMVSNDVGRLREEGARRTLPACILTPTGQVVSDLTLCDARDALVPSGMDCGVILTLPAQTVSRVAALLDRYIISEDVTLRTHEPVHSLLLLGDRARRMADGSADGELLNRLSRCALVTPTSYAGLEGAVLHYCGADRDTLLALLAGAAVPQIGADAIDILRIEAGVAKYGAEIDETMLAPEAGLMATHISLTKGCYVGQEIVARIESRGHTNRELTGLLILGETQAAAGEKLYVSDVLGDGKETGRITSVARFSPAAGGRPIALGYVRHEHRSAGSWLHVGSADSRRMVEVAELPFRPSISRET